MKDRLLKICVWDCNYAKKERKRGRASGGFIIGKRKGWGNKDDRLISRVERSNQS